MDGNRHSTTEPSFEKLLVLLAEAKVDFVLVGGLAVSLQGYVRFTEDVDLLVSDSPENLSRLLGTLANYGEGHARDLTVGDFTDEEGCIRVIEAVEQCQLALFTRMSGRRYEDVIADADTFRIGSTTIHFASKQALIGWKADSHREKDRLDALALEELIRDPHAFD